MRCGHHKNHCYLRSSPVHVAQTVLRRRRPQVNEGALSAKCFPRTYVLTAGHNLFRDPGRDPEIAPELSRSQCAASQHGTRRREHAVINLLLLTLLQHHIKLRHGRHRRQHGGSYLPSNFVLDTDEYERGNWGPWSNPSSCSRSCGGGVAHQTRQCLDIE